MPTTAKFSLSEYERMVDSGIFAGLDERLRSRRIELLKGEIVEMSPIGDDHADLVSWISWWSGTVVPRDLVHVRAQQPIRLPDSNSRPEPDITWTTPRPRRAPSPLPADILLLVEVASSSLRDDRTIKADIYAEAGIADYWIVNIPDQQVEIFRDPSPTGYRDKTIIGLGGSVASLASPEAVLRVDELFAIEG